MSDQHSSAHARHDDDRIVELREEFGENANLTVEELQERARDQGATNVSSMNKRELLEIVGREHQH